MPIPVLKKRAVPIGDAPATPNPPGVDWAARIALENNDPTTARRVMPDLPRGILRLGNLDLNARPTVQNADGSHSTEYSTSFGDEQGREVLVPTIVKGRFLTPSGLKPPEGSPEEEEMFRAAQQHYKQTREHLGIFSNPVDADEYAEAVHNRVGILSSRPRQRFVVTPSQ